MKKLIFILIFYPLLTFAQTEESKCIIKMKTESGSENQELQDILNFEKIDYYKTEFIGADLKGKHYSLVVKEIWDGKVKHIDTILNTANNKYLKPLHSDTLSLRVIAKKTAEKKLKINFRFPQIGIEKTFEATRSDHYSLRDFGTRITIESNKPFYAFAYILPYEKNDFKYYCDVENSGKNIESWGKEFGIKHYVLFEMNFK
jgi:hypothetical protein